jgi:hypothetical protein
MAEYLTCSSGGMNRSTESISDVLPADEDDWMSTARGLSSLRLVAAKYPASRLVSSPTTPQASKSAVIRCSKFGSFSSSSAAS